MTHQQVGNQRFYEVTAEIRHHINQEGDTEVFETERLWMREDNIASALFALDLMGDLMANGFPHTATYFDPKDHSITENQTMFFRTLVLQPADELEVRLRNADVWNV